MSVRNNPLSGNPRTYLSSVFLTGRGAWLDNSYLFPYFLLRSLLPFSNSIFLLIAECLSMRHIILRGRRVPTVKYAVCIYIYLFIGLSGSTVVNDSLQSLFIHYAWNATCCLHEVVESPCYNQLLFTAYCHEWNKTLDEATLN